MYIIMLRPISLYWKYFQDTMKKASNLSETGNTWYSLFLEAECTQRVCTQQIYFYQFFFFLSQTVFKHSRKFSSVKYFTAFKTATDLAQLLLIKKRDKKKKRRINQMDNV